MSVSPAASAEQPPRRRTRFVARPIPPRPVSRVATLPPSFPTEILLNVLDWLGPLSLARCLYVSRAFAEAAIHTRFARISIEHDVSSDGSLSACPLIGTSC